MQGKFRLIGNFHWWHKVIAIIVSISFILSGLTQYPPEAYAENILKTLFQISSELGTIDESHEGNSGKTILYIQDAHDSLEAQEHIAELILSLTRVHNIKTVFEEGYEGAVPTDKLFGFIKNPNVKKKVSYFLLDKLRIAGAEYAHINRIQDFKLIGIDQLKLYRKNISWYQKAAKKREDTDEDLNEFLKHITQLANQYFPKDLKTWLKIKERFVQTKLPLLDYLKELKRLSKASISENEFIMHYPLLALLLKVHLLRDSELEIKLTSIDSKALFEELDQLEKNFSKIYLTSERDQKIFNSYQDIVLLKRLNQIELTQSEYEAVKDTLKSIKTEMLLNFIVEYTQKPLVLSKAWERNIKNAVQFYEAAHDRDVSIETYLKDFLQNSDEKIAILVFGGFHGTKIKEILKSQNFSYSVISPKITSIDKEHQDYYKQLMAVGHYSFETPFHMSRAARAESLFLFEASAAQYALRAIASIVQRLNRQSNMSFEPLLRNRLIEQGLTSYKLNQKKRTLSNRTRSEMRSWGHEILIEGHPPIFVEVKGKKKISITFSIDDHEFGKIATKLKGSDALDESTVERLFEVIEKQISLLLEEEDFDLYRLDERERMFETYEPILRKTLSGQAAGESKEPGEILRDIIKQTLDDMGLSDTPNNLGGYDSFVEQFRKGIERDTEQVRKIKEQTESLPDKYRARVVIWIELHSKPGEPHFGGFFQNFLYSLKNLATSEKEWEQDRLKYFEALRGLIFEDDTDLSIIALQILSFLVRDNTVSLNELYRPEDYSRLLTKANVFMDKLQKLDAESDYHFYYSRALENLSHIIVLPEKYFKDMAAGLAHAKNWSDFDRLEDARIPIFSEETLNLFLTAVKAQNAKGDSQGEAAYLLRDFFLPVSLQQQLPESILRSLEQIELKGGDARRDGQKHLIMDVVANQTQYGVLSQDGFKMIFDVLEENSIFYDHAVLMIGKVAKNYEANGQIQALQAIRDLLRKKLKGSKTLEAKIRFATALIELGHAFQLDAEDFQTLESLAVAPKEVQSSLANKRSGAFIIRELPKNSEGDRAFMEMLDHYEANLDIYILKGHVSPFYVVRKLKRKDDVSPNYVVDGFAQHITSSFVSDLKIRAYPYFFSDQRSLTNLRITPSEHDLKYPIKTTESYVWADNKLWYIRPTDPSKVKGRKLILVHEDGETHEVIDHANYHQEVEVMNHFYEKGESFVIYGTYGKYTQPYEVSYQHGLTIAQAVQNRLHTVAPTGDADSYASLDLEAISYFTVGVQEPNPAIESLGLNPKQDAEYLRDDFDEASPHENIIYHKSYSGSESVVAWRLLGTSAILLGVEYQGIKIPFVQFEMSFLGSTHVIGLSSFVPRKLLTRFASVLRLPQLKLEQMSEFIARQASLTLEDNPQLEFSNEEPFKRLLELSHQILHSTVKVQVYKNEKLVSSGTGNLISVNGKNYILTAAHVVEKDMGPGEAVGNEYKIRFQNGRTYSAKIEAYSWEGEVAILSLMNGGISFKIPFLSIQEENFEGHEPVVYIGFPGITDPAQQIDDDDFQSAHPVVGWGWAEPPKNRSARLNAPDYQYEHGWSFLVSDSPSVSGMSGGAVISLKTGNLVGVLSSGSGSGRNFTAAMIIPYINSVFRKESMRSELRANQIIRDVRLNSPPVTVFINAQDFPNLSLDQKNEYLYVALTKNNLRLVVYHENNEVKDQELEALLKLAHVVRTEKNLDQALLTFSRPNVPNIHLSKKILPNQTLVRNLKKKVSFFKEESDKAGTLAVALLWALSDSEGSNFWGVSQGQDGFWTVVDSLIDSLQRSYNTNLVFAWAA